MATDRMIRIVVADDHPIVRDGLKQLLGMEPGFLVVGEAGDGIEAVQVTRQLRPDVLLLDLTMPRGTGLDVLKALAEPPCEVRTIVLTAGFERDVFLTALQFGARGIVLKESATTQVFKSIRCVMDGEYWLDRENVATIVQALRRLAVQVEDHERKHRFDLTRRELQIVAGVATGQSNKEIAEDLSLSDETVKCHLSHIYDKLGVFSRLELAVFAINHGLAQDRVPA